MLEQDLFPVSYYTSDAADEGLGVDLGGRRIIKKKSIDRTVQRRRKLIQS